MSESLTRTLAVSWQAALDELALPAGPRTVLAGKGIEADIESFAMMSGPPLAGAHGQIALFGMDLAEIDLDDASIARLPLDDDTVDLVVVLHGWDDPRHLLPIAREAARVLHPGGGLVLGELDVDRLGNSTPTQYGSALMYGTQREAAGRLADVCVDRVELEVALIQLGLLPVRSMPFDRATAVFGTPQEMNDRIASGHWKMSGAVPADSLESLGSVLAGLVDEFPHTDLEPWHLVAGTTAY